MIVTEAIYDVRESDNCPRTFETHFTCTSDNNQYVCSCSCHVFVEVGRAHRDISSYDGRTDDVSTWHFPRWIRPIVVGGVESESEGVID